MKKIFLGMILLLGYSVVAFAQEIPEGVRYKRTSDEINKKATAMLERAFSADATLADKRPIFANGAIMIGPFLWEVVKTPDVFKGATPVSLIVNGKVAQGRGIRDAAQQQVLWDRVLKRTSSMGAVKIRKPQASEISFFWAMIPFDIEEPLLIADFGAERYIFNFVLKDGKPNIMWIDIVGDLKTLK